MLLSPVESKAKFKCRETIFMPNHLQSDTPVYSDSIPVDPDVLAMRYGTNATQKCNALQAVEEETPEWKDQACQTWINYICEYERKDCVYC